ncbi:glycogen debranching protein [Labilibacter sediminis]|nr:glycogen debranching protein [Labilibacter sediminis]
MKKITYILAIASLFGCKQSPKQLYQNKDFTVYNNKVTQGDFEAKVLSDGSMTSNYKSPDNNPRTRTIELKFSINQKDNELPFNTNHQIVVKPTNGIYETPLITFGKQYIDKESGINEPLELNTTLKIKLDMSPVFNAFEKMGYFEDLNGDKIYKDDFKGVSVAGNIVPLNFDFENLGGDVELHDKDGDHIFELTININTHDPDRYIKPDWKLTQDISKYPVLKTDNPLIQSLYNMALEETVLLSEDDGTFRTGAKWEGVWTRDVSYAIILGMGIADAQRARHSLLKKTKRNRIIQDTGSGGAWPVSSDRTTWALAAWEIYLITGDQLMLDYAYQVIKNSVDDDRKVVYNANTGLYRGESSFLDWRVQTYPRWMDNVDIYSSQNLGTNMVHYQTLTILSEMAKLQNENKLSEQYSTWADDLKSAINQHFWNEDKGYYIQYLFGRNFDLQSPKSEALGEAFAVLFDVAGDKTQTVIESTPFVTWGMPCVYPQIPDMRPYHNNGIWPFVQAFWNMAAAKAGNGTALEHGMSSFYRASAMFLTNKENMVAENGDFITALNSDRQLWSVGGNLGMVYKILFGIGFSPENTIGFTPTIPKAYQSKMELQNLKIRDKIFNIKISGYGNQIKSFKLDGKLIDQHAVSLIGEGVHHIEIKMANNNIDGKVNLVDNKFHLATPSVENKDGLLSWKEIDGATNYEIYKNGQNIETTSNLTYNTNNILGEYTIRAIDSEGDVSFFSEPLVITTNKITFKIYPFAKDRSISVESSPKSMIELSKTKNRTLNWKINIKKEGLYHLYFDYTNGNGPWNTDNKCAIRTLLINKQFSSPIVMAQRGQNEWASIGQTNIIKAQLNKGVNHFQISFEDENENMNFDYNKALLGNLTLIKL